MSYQNTPYNAPPYSPYQKLPPDQIHSGEHVGHSNVQDNKFADVPKFRDPFWGLLFMVHLIGVVILCITGTEHYNKQDHSSTTHNTNNSTATNSTSNGLTTEELNHIVTVTFSSIAVAFMFNFLYLVIVRKFATTLIIGTIIFSVMMWFGFAILLLATGNIIGGIFMLLIAGINALFFYWWRNRIPFASAMLKTISQLIQEYPATTYVSYLSIVVHIIYMIFFAWTVNVANSLGQSYTYLLAVFLVFSYYWTTQVIKNVVHVTVSGMMATWYFLKLAMPSNPTVRSFKRAVSTSFGSICLGSLLVALLQTLRTILKWARDRNNAIATMIVDCILGCIENLLRYFNLYAFTQVAIYGKTYCEAARDTWDLISSHGFQAIVNDNLISNVLTMGAFVGAIVTAIFSGVLGLLLVKSLVVLCVVIGFIVGFTMSIVCMEVVQSSVATIFVCFAMDREALRRNDPFLFDKLVSTYNIY